MIGEDALPRSLGGFLGPSQGEKKLINWFFRSQSILPFDFVGIGGSTACDAQYATHWRIGSSNTPAATSQTLFVNPPNRISWESAECSTVLPWVFMPTGHEAVD
jgi:hypothetical protein